MQPALRDNQACHLLTPRAPDLMNPDASSSRQRTMVAESFMDSFVHGQCISTDQVEHSAQANMMALLQVPCRQKEEARQQHTHITRRTVSSKEDGTGTSMSCILLCPLSVFFSAQWTTQPWGLMVEMALAARGCHMCCPGMCCRAHVHLPPQIRALSRSLPSRATSCRLRPAPSPLHSLSPMM